MCVLLALALAWQPARAAQVWFAAVDPFMRHFKGLPQNDFLEMFTPAADWRLAAAGTQVFILSNQFALAGVDQDLRQVLAGVAARHMVLAVEGQMLTSSDRCGQKVEGYAGPRNIERALTRLKVFGADVRYLAMDEPMLYGHRVARGDACQDTIENVARQVAVKVAQARRIYPRIQIGDIESVGDAPGSSLLDDLQNFFSAYRAATGETLAFFHADVSWSHASWPSDLRRAADITHAAGIAFGIIYNGSPDDQTDLAWTENAEERIRTIEDTLGVHPDHAIIETWTRHPEANLPEKTPGTLTNLLMHYVGKR